MKVDAPFHVGEEYGGDWILYAFKAELVWIDRVGWDYWKVQRLAAVSDRLRLEHEAETWRRRRKSRGQINLTGGTERHSFDAAKTVGRNAVR